jgi:phage-related protein
MTTELKPIYWAGASKSELLAFSADALQDAGYQLHRLQKGNTPQDWKPLTGLGKGITGVYEIRIWESKTTYRVAYVTKFKGYVTVLHCWQKTTQTTSKVDKDIIINRYKSAKERL